MSALKSGARWYAKLHGARQSAAMRKACDAWRMESPEQDRAFTQIAELSSACEQLKGDPDILTLRKDVLQRSFRRVSWLTAPKIGVVAATVALCVAVTSVFIMQQPGELQPGGAQVQNAQSAPARLAVDTQAPDYHTKTGERSVVTLIDGSLVTMNTDTRLRTEYTKGQRNVILLQGQAIFKVAKDHDRPFRVMAGGQVVTAVGTEFEVRAERDSLSVTLLEGKVKIGPVMMQGSPSNELATTPIDLAPGQRVELVVGRAPLISALDLGRALSWREGRLEFQNERLASAVREFNRYSEKKLVLTDPSLGDLRIGGSFKTDSTSNFVLALEALYPVTAMEDKQANQISLSWD